MEGISQAVVVPIGIGNCCSENRREIAQLKLITETITILSDSASELTAEVIKRGDVLSCEVNDLVTGKHGGCNPDLELQVSKDVESTGAHIELDHSHDSFYCPPVVSDSNNFVTAKSPLMKVDVDIASKNIFNNFMETKNHISIELPLIPGSNPNLKMQMSVRNVIVDTRKHIRFNSNYMPLWGCSSVCGGRREMEDAVMAMPCFSCIPLWLLTNGKEEVDNLDPALDHLTAHFFGAYDGHGGSEVADYCREHIHLELLKEIRNLEKDKFSRFEDGCVKQWERAFTNCFRKVDADVAGNTGTLSRDGCCNFVAPETVGSTAVVAVICSSHIIISNCGDSRAVLYRGKETVPLSEDHKPKRADELARIESVGGKVIEWNGFRLSAVLAMSRSIENNSRLPPARDSSTPNFFKRRSHGLQKKSGDRYLKPSIIPDPEVKFVPRMKEDECLIIATDGLWDVMTNEEVCEVTRRRILMWHKKNIMNHPPERGLGADPAAQAAADYLIKLAQHKGSKDNITVIVVDLKAQRKFKRKA